MAFFTALLLACPPCQAQFGCPRPPDADVCADWVAVAREATEARCAAVAALAETLAQVATTSGECATASHGLAEGATRRRASEDESPAGAAAVSPWVAPTACMAAVVGVLAVGGVYAPKRARSTTTTTERSARTQRHAVEVRDLYRDEAGPRSRSRRGGYGETACLPPAPPPAMPAPVPPRGAACTAPLPLPLTPDPCVTSNVRTASGCAQGKALYRRLSAEEIRRGQALARRAPYAVWLDVKKEHKLSRSATSVPRLRVPCQPVSESCPVDGTRAHPLPRALAVPRSPAARDLKNNTHKTIWAPPRYYGFNDDGWLTDSGGTRIIVMDSPAKSLSTGLVLPRVQIGSLNGVPTSTLLSMKKNDKSEALQWTGMHADWIDNLIWTGPARE